RNSPNTKGAAARMRKRISGARSRGMPITALGISSRMPYIMPRHSLVMLALLFLSSGVGAEEIDHARLIRAWNNESFARGKQLYETMCITCHGTPEKEGTLPTSRRFWLEPFKNGNDPFSIYKTLARGFGQMPAWTFLTPEQRYDAIHFVREAFIRPQNPAAYFKVDDR